jgi:HKD family nuclease
MTKLSLIKPLDQPPGTRRLLDELKRALGDPRFTEFRFIVAYAKSGPLHRIRRQLESWKAAGKRVEAILGIDQRGTSKDAIELGLALLSNVYVTQEMGITFHPKIYLFKGPAHAEAFVGSNNLTVGGTEKNFEAAVHIQFDLPGDAGELKPFEDAWRELLPAACPATKVLDAAELARLITEGLVIDEKSMRAGANGDSASVAGRRRGARSGLYVKPESPLPRNALGAAAPPAIAPAIAGIGPAPKAAVPTATARGLAIQISSQRRDLPKRHGGTSKSFFLWLAFRRNDRAQESWQPIVPSADS